MLGQTPKQLKLKGQSREQEHENFLFVGKFEAFW
jgi:hypothetical protein